MKQTLYLGVLLLLAITGSGCLQTDTSGQSDVGAFGLSCNTLDYGIQEFSLLASNPIVSQSYNLKISVEQMGDCPAQSLTVSLYEQDTMVKQYELTNPSSTTPLDLTWAPKTDESINLRAKLEILDDNLDNNEETIYITGYPLGNYLNITNLTGDTITASSSLAEQFSIDAPLKMQSVELFLKQSQKGNQDGHLYLDIAKDQDNKPGEVIFSTKTDLTLQDQFEWYKVTSDLTLNIGKYWIIVKQQNDSSLIWHYARIEQGGSKIFNMDPLYRYNSSTVAIKNNTIELLPEKDYSYKIHATD